MLLIDIKKKQKKTVLREVGKNTVTEMERKEEMSPLSCIEFTVCYLFTLPCRFPGEL